MLTGLLLTYQLAVAPVCTVGKPCGNACISVNDICHIGVPDSGPGILRITTEWVNTDVIGKRFGVCQQFLKAGISNIPKDNQEYRSDLDINHNGMACEANGADNALPEAVKKAEWESELLLPEKATPKVMYVDIEQLGSLGSLSILASGDAQLIVNGTSLTFGPGKKRTYEGQKIEAVPFEVGNLRKLMVPLSSLKLAKCSISATAKTFTAKCPDGSSVTAPFRVW